MPDRSRLPFDGAFKLPSRNINYYRDMFLLWPILAFSFAATTQIIFPESPEYRIYGLKLAACATAAIVLAKERLILIGAGAAFVGIRLAFALAVTQDWRSYWVGLLVSGGIVIAVLWMRKDWKPSYESTVKTNFLSLAVVAAGLGSTVAIGL
jgi:hypothetical protein